eukprot:TRINITY_DN4012_c0_g1_i5.p1 TRINITY_DN4012_c0_g1~~TRINITY_DN4012_c0_g1_i5.p1  ORF type:complete len:225 (-),score=62.15 TRINITY_DN4012_c0_g1_i5:150-824(-)
MTVSVLCIFIFCVVFFFFSSRRRHTRCREVSWARRCVQETGINAEYMGKLEMKLSLIALLVVLNMTAVRGAGIVEIVFGILEGAVKVLQTNSTNDPTGCYIQVNGLHESAIDLENSIQNGEETVVIISNAIDMIKNLVCIYAYCEFHDIDDDIEHFSNHPGDLIGRLVWNYGLTADFIKDIINGTKNRNFFMIGEGIGSLIYVVFDGQILQFHTTVFKLSLIHI